MFSVMVTKTVRVVVTPKPRLDCPSFESLNSIDSQNPGVVEGV